MAAALYTTAASIRRAPNLGTDKVHPIGNASYLASMMGYKTEGAGLVSDQVLGQMIVPNYGIITVTTTELAVPAVKASTLPVSLQVLERWACKAGCGLVLIAVCCAPLRAVQAMAVQTAFMFSTTVDHK